MRQSAEKKLHTCILTLQADRPGGIPTVDDWWWRFLDRWGHRATVLYAAFIGDGISRFERLRMTLKTWRVHNRPEHPNPTIANAPLPVPLWLMYFVPQWIFGSLLNSFDQVVVSGGPCLHALPLALRRYPYIVWIGTLYEDELRGKVAIGDRWASGVLNSPLWPFLAWQERVVLRRAAHIHAQSPYTLRRIREELPEVADRASLTMVPVLTPDSKQSSASSVSAQPYILNVSRINDPRKDIATLFRAFAIVASEKPDLRLVLAGDEPKPALLNQCEALGIAGRVVFMGKVSVDELHELYRQAELLVISSAQEGLGIVMLEAMAFGTPVVATDCGGPEGIVVDGKTGKLVPIGDAEAMAAALIDLLSNSEQAALFGENCAAFIRQNCSEEAVEQSLRQSFAKVFPVLQVADGGDSENENRRPQLGRINWLAAAAWSVLVFSMYVWHQWLIHGDAVHRRLLQPFFWLFK